MPTNTIVAIDGPSGVGKSTVARGVAHDLKYAFIDTGALYRACALLSQEAGIDWSDGRSIANEISTHQFAFDSEGNLSIDGVDVKDRIRTSEISMGASRVARHPQVRDALLTIQRHAGKTGSAVLEGRDIGTVVFPESRTKFYLTASVRTRAQRRFDEMKAKGIATTLKEVEADQIRRDYQDANRDVAPLRKATDAIEIISDDMTAIQVIHFIVETVKNKSSK